MMVRKLPLVAFALAALVVAAQAAVDHHCKLADGTFDGTKTEKQCKDAKGTWEQDASYTGQLATGVAAIGGETTGIAIAVGPETYELDVHGNKALQAAAAELSGKRVTVTGYLTTKHGVEVRDRHIIVVSTLAAAKSR